MMVIAIVVAAVIVASVIRAVVVATCWAMSARILVEAYLGFLDVGVLVGGRNHLTNPGRRLAVELGAKLVVVESSDEGGDDLSFRDVGNRVPHLGTASDVATEGLGRLLVDAAQIVLGAWSSTGSHIIIGEDFFSILPRIQWSPGQGWKTSSWRLA